MIKRVGACPVCGQEMDEMAVRQTASGVMCLECVFKQDYERRQGRGAAVAIAGAGAAPNVATGSSSGALTGFLAGFVCGLVGLLIVLVTGKSDKMKSAAVAGFVAQIALGVMIRLALT